MSTNYFNKLSVNSVYHEEHSSSLFRPCVKPAALTIAVSLILMGYSSCANATKFQDIEDSYPSISCSGNVCTIDGDLTISSSSESLSVGYEGSTLVIKTGTMNFGDNSSISAGRVLLGSGVSTSGNTISISGSTDGEISTSAIYGGFAHADIEVISDKNTLVISSGVIKANELYAGYAKSYDGDVRASGNTLTISGATLASQKGTQLNITAGLAGEISYFPFSTTTGSDNTLKIVNTSIRNDNSLSLVQLKAADLSGFEVTGLNNTFFLDNVSFPTRTYIWAASVLGQRDNPDYLTTMVTLSDNKVYLGSISGTNTMNVGGAHVSGVYHATLTLKNNAVYVYGTSDLSNSKLYGARLEDCSYVDVDASGNTLFFGYNGTPWTSSGNYSIGTVSGFNNITFSSAVWGKTVSIANFAGAVSSTGTYEETTVVDASKVDFSGSDTINVGSSYKMLTAGNIVSGSLDLASTSSKFTFGTAVEGYGKVSLEDSDGDGKNDTVVFTVSAPDPSNPSDSGIRATAQTHSAAMVPYASVIALNQGADTSSSAAFNLAHSGVTGTQVFSSVGGGAARAKTGSHITLNSLNFSVGVGRNIASSKGLFSIGGAFEGGYGRFKNHFDAGAYDSFIKKSGNVSYYGVALLGSMEFTNLWHVNAALRYGKVSSKVKNGLYDAGVQRNYDIDVSSYYFGAELGGGKVIKITEKDSIDLYGKYFFLYQRGDTFRTSAEIYDVDAVTSHRLRVAGRYMHSFTPKTSLYAGLGIEREFDGKSKLKIKTNVGTLNAEPSEAKGTRAFAEIGFTIVPPDNKGFNFDLGIKGQYGQKYRGIWTSADAKYKF